MGVLLFIFVIVSGSGDDDLDIDATVDADVDVDADIDADANASDFSFAQALGWVGIGKAPLILLLATDLSLWGLAGWMLNVSVGSRLSSLVGGLVGSAILGASLLIALFIGGQLAKPIGHVFASFGEDASSDRLVGCIGTVSTGRIPIITEAKIGQVDVLDSARNLVTVNAIVPDWASVSPQRGDKVLVIERLPQGYLVIAKDSPDQERWLGNASDTKNLS